MTENQAKWSLYNTGGNDVDTATMYFFENIENPAIQVPCKIKKVAEKKAAGGKPACNPESVMMIESMGFSKEQAERALRKCDGNVERACDWIFSHMDEPPSEEEMDVDQDNSQSVQVPNLFACTKPEQGNYKFSKFITHLGASVHAGHYVCHVRRGQEWIYFNDCKVAQCPEPPFGKGFVYVFQKQ